ncbi:NAD-dependent epimerase/dehydratase family protein [Nocardioides pacificus]
MTSPASPLTWVIGSGGLLGSAAVRQAEHAALPVHTTMLPWEDPAAVGEVLGAEAALLLRAHPRVRVLWCAGAGVVGTGPAALAAEVEVIASFVDRLASLLAEQPQTSLSFFLASSAGGVYAGSADPPFTEATRPRPLAPYGEAKLAAEGVLTRFAERTGTPLLIGRIANLYGPGQDLRKAQGLISQLCRSQLLRRPLMLYVPLDTARDYIYVDDAAQMVLAAMRMVEVSGGTVVKIIASGRATALAAVIGELRRLTNRRTPIVLGATPQSRLQATHLRFRSVVLPEVDRLARTPLPAGIHATYQHISAELRRPA